MDLRVITSSDPEAIREIHRRNTLIVIFEQAVPEEVTECLNNSEFHKRNGNPENISPETKPFNSKMPAIYRGNDLEIFYDHLLKLQSIFAARVGEVLMPRGTDIEMTPINVKPLITHQHVDKEYNWGTFAGVTVHNTGESAEGGNFRYQDSHGLWHHAPIGSLIVFQHQKDGELPVRSPNHQATPTRNGCRVRANWVALPYDCD